MSQPLCVTRIRDFDNGTTADRKVWFAPSQDELDSTVVHTYEDRFGMEVGKTYLIDQSWREPNMETRSEVSMLQERVTELTQQLAEFKRFGHRREGYHANYNGGHHDDKNREAFHHGMDTVFNGFEAFTAKMNVHSGTGSISAVRHEEDRFDNDDSHLMIDLKRQFDKGDVYNAFCGLLGLMRKRRQAALEAALKIRQSHE